MRRFLLQIGSVFIGIFFLLSVLDIAFTWIISENSLFGIGRNEKVDFLIGGDSRSELLKADYLGHITGKKVLCFSMGALNLDEFMKLTDYFFKNGNTAKTVLIQMDTKFGTHQMNRREPIYYAHFLRQDGLLKPRFPFMFYMKNRGDIKLEKVLGYAKNIFKRAERGRFRDTTSINFEKFNIHDEFLIDYSKRKFRIDELHEFRSYLLSKGVKEVIFYTTPYAPSWADSQSDSASFKSKLRNAGFSYVDLSHMYGDTSFFVDHLHLKQKMYWDFNRNFAEKMMGWTRPLTSSR